MRRSGPVLFIAFLLFAFALLAPSPHPAHADSRVFPAGYWGPLLSCTGNYIDPAALGGVSDHKTCNNFCDLLHTGQNTMDFAITLVVFVGAPGMVAFGGIMLLVAGTSGSGENRKLAQDIIVSALIGVAITLAAYIILSTFLWLFGNGPNSAVQVSWPDIVCNLQ